jgi:hypothetical protein
MNRIQLQQEIEKTQKQLNRLQEQLNKSFPTIEEANVGELLEDGCVVIEKYNGLVLIAAPKVTEVECNWTPEFKCVFDKLKEHNFIPSQWFIPSLKQLALAYKNAKQYFSPTFHWSSTEASSTSTLACDVNFRFGSQGTYSKSNRFWVRAFRFVEI